jgi:hypothetical protein
MLLLVQTFLFRHSEDISFYVFTTVVDQIMVFVWIFAPCGGEEFSISKEHTASIFRVTGWV